VYRVHNAAQLILDVGKEREIKLKRGEGKKEKGRGGKGR